MQNKSVWQFFLVSLLFVPILAVAGTEVIEGKAAKQFLEEQRSSAIVLSQKDKTFIFNGPNGESVQKPQEITVKVGEYLFITNDEERTVHNIYDLVDRSWVLKKQIPGGIAALKFSEPQVHKLNCAIHPQMRVMINVIE